ncbi:hypothetical protein AVEN_14107-1 [Araneus ventricosus]|uniref:Uncharacterized protein n=1 Tax=Araneus ventricosus TaxID=182803 RepID=A0A4Y2UR40_ARAVE|nr:hypothetical protein AVEN_14107-1 [Araneus ventricosus]
MPALFAENIIVTAGRLNMAMRVIATHVKDKRILVIMMWAGEVKTDMGTDKVVLEIKESIWTTIKTLPKLPIGKNFFSGKKNIYRLMKHRFQYDTVSYWKRYHTGTGVS